MVNVKPNEYFNFINSSKYVVVDFWATWCTACPQATEVVKNVIKKLDSKVVIGKVNVEEHEEVSNSLGIASLPKVVLYVDGVMVADINAPITTHKMLSSIKSFIE